MRFIDRSVGRPVKSKFTAIVRLVGKAGATFTRSSLNSNLTTSYRHRPLALR